MNQKRQPYRNKKLLAASKGRSCVNCGANDGTVVRAHYTGIRQHLYGKGMSQKCDDYVSADLCVKCHAAFDQYQTDDQWKATNSYKKVDLSEQFLHLVIMTLRRDLDEKIIV